MGTDTDDWAAGRLDLDGYLRRIGYPGPTDPSGTTLEGLYRAHLAAVRFENLGLFIDGGVRVDLESVQQKIVSRGRGGYCYEHAQLLGAALERLGFGVRRRLARVGPDGGPARPRTHLTLHVQAGQQAWLADPGFGSSPPAPLRYCSGGSQEVDGWTYEVTPGTEHGAEVRKLREYQDGQWVTLHRWDDAVVQPADVLLANHYTATHPDSWFTWQPVLVRRDPDAIRSIVGRTYTVTRAGYRRTRAELTDHEFAAALTGEFALPLTADEVAAAVAAPVSRDRPAPPGLAPGI